jgi:peptide subunit release factor 1 (eRF1)
MLSANLKEKIQMMVNLTHEEKSLLSAIIKRAGDVDVSKWLGQEKQVLDTFKSASDESFRRQIEITYQQLLKEIEDASRFDNT